MNLYWTCDCLWQIEFSYLSSNCQPVLSLRHLEVIQWLCSFFELVTGLQKACILGDGRRGAVTPANSQMTAKYGNEASYTRQLQVASQLNADPRGRPANIRDDGNADTPQIPKSIECLLF